MSLLVWSRRSGASQEGTLDYRATSDDPWFSYSFLLKSPHAMVFYVGAIDGQLDPKLYVDRGNSFDEADTVSLPGDHESIFVVRFPADGKIRGLRFDPTSAPGAFRYWAKAAWSEAGLAKALQRGREHAKTSVQPQEIAIEGGVSNRRARLLARVSEHYASVIEMAESIAPPESRSPADPMISFVVPVFNSPPAYLNDLYASFQKQTPGVSEIIMVDDGSTSKKTRSWLAARSGAPAVQVIHTPQNRGIAHATNVGIRAARGEWIGFLDHDDALSPGTVKLLLQTMRDHPNCQFIYTDEVVTDERLRPVIYFLKPSYDEVLLSGVNYINHLSCFRRDRLLALGAFHQGYDGSQDYEFLLRYVRELSSDEIKHMPYPAYRWRRSRNAFSVRSIEQATVNARRALGARYSKDGRPAPIDPALTDTLHRVRFDRQTDVWPKVSVVIPNKDSAPLISRVIEDLIRRTDYPNIEIIVVDNGSTDPSVIELYRGTAKGDVPFLYDIEPAPFNFSRQVNRGIGLASGDFILLMNNDVEVTDPEWMREMVSCFQYPNTGIVGARLLYPNGRIQHVGVVVGLGGLAGHVYHDKRKDYPGPMARLHVRQTMTAVTGACMMLSRACVEAIGSFDEVELSIAYNDVDYCIRATNAGFRVVWTPFATLVHHESQSRGSDELPENRERFDREKAILRRRHRTDIFQDRWFSPWYSRDRSDPRPVRLKELPKAR